MVQSQGLTPTAIDVDVFALANAWELCGVPDDVLPDDQSETPTGQERAIALVDVGATRTSINVICLSETCFSREIGIGGNEMTQALSNFLGNIAQFGQMSSQRIGQLSALPDQQAARTMDGHCCLLLLGLDRHKPR